jgi:hypothetical protein
VSHAGQGDFVKEVTLNLSDKPPPTAKWDELFSRPCSPGVARPATGLSNRGLPMPPLPHRFFRCCLSCAQAASATSPAGYIVNAGATATPGRFGKFRQLQGADRPDVTPGGQPASRFTWRTTDGSSTPSRWPATNLHEQPSFMTGQRKRLR